MSKASCFAGRVWEKGGWLAIRFEREEVSGITTMVHDDGSTHHYANLHNFRQVEIGWDDAIKLRRTQCPPNTRTSETATSNPASR